MKILITERQLKTLVENATLNNAFRSLKVGDILVLRVVLKAGEQHDYKFKVVEDMGESWKLANFNVGSTNTGFDWFIDKGESLTDSQVLFVKSSKKDKKKVRVLLKGVISAKLGDDILSITTTGDVVDIEDVKRAYVMALKSIEDEDGLTPEAAHDSAINIVKQEFGDIPEVEIIDNGYKRKRGTGGNVGGDYVNFDDIPNVDITDTAGYGKVNKGGKSNNIDAEDVDYMDVSDLDGLVVDIKKRFKEGNGVRFTLRDGESISVINFNVLSVSGDTAEIKLVETDDSEYDKYRKGRFIMTFDRSYIEVNDKTVDIKLLIADADGDIQIKNIAMIEATSKNDDEVKIDRGQLLKFIQSDPILMNAFAKTPTLMGLINVGDVRGLSKAYELLNKSGFDLDGSKSGNNKSGNFSDRFSSNYSAKIRLLRDVKFLDGNPIEAGEKKVTVRRSRNTVILTDSERNTYKILKDLGNDIYEVNAQRKEDTSGEKVTIKVLEYKTQN
jgi:ribosomal protein L13